MINILFIHQSAELYGSDMTLLLLLKNLNKDVFFPIVILPNEGPLKCEIEKLNIKVVTTPVLKLYRNMFTIKKFSQFFYEKKLSIKILDKLHSEYHFDIIYSNTLAVLLGMIYSSKRKIKHLWHVHEIIVHPKFIARIFSSLLYNFADVVICNSKATAVNLFSNKKKLKEITKVIYNGIEVQNLDKSTSKNLNLDFKTNDIVITLVGRISRIKGQKWLISTFVNHLSEIKNIKILFVGSSVLGQENYLNEIKEIIIQKNLSDQIKILDFTKNLEEVWKVTDIAIMPSVEAESFGLVAVEAMLAQKPVIASNHGGLTEIILDNETGFLVEPNNELELSIALKKLIFNSELRLKFGQRGYQRVIKEFSIKQHVEHFEKTFIKLINN